VAAELAMVVASAGSTDGCVVPAMKPTVRPVEQIKVKMAAWMAVAMRAVRRPWTLAQPAQRVRQPE